MDIGQSEIADYIEESAEPWEWAQYRLDPLEFYEDEMALISSWSYAGGRFNASGPRNY